MGNPLLHIFCDQTIRMFHFLEQEKTEAVDLEEDF